MMPTSTGTQTRAAAILSGRWMIRASMNHRKPAAQIPPITGEITQLAAMVAIICQLTADSPAATIPEPMTPPSRPARRSM